MLLRVTDAGGVTETAYKNMPSPVCAPSVGTQILQIVFVTIMYSMIVIVVVFIGK